MDQKIKQEWVTALRSGEYEQGCLGLYNSRKNTYCCLGVLADIMVKHKQGEWIEPLKPQDINFKIFKYTNTENSGFIPTDLANDLSMDYCLCTEAASRNDSGESFNDIAAFIENQF